jgi:hypothetical protein
MTFEIPRATTPEDLKQKFTESECREVIESIKAVNLQLQNTFSPGGEAVFVPCDSMGKSTHTRRKVMVHFRKAGWNVGYYPNDRRGAGYLFEE